MNLGSRRISLDLLSVILLVALCWLFYWRLLTPNPLNQQSLIEGDFSGQFVAFAQYQAERFQQGQVPLWNPYNDAGHPFVADTQAAVFYPPRLITITILNSTGGSTPQRMYDALQKEMVAHVLIASLLMYAFVRRLTMGQPYSVTGGLIAAITFAYGGYLTGYPQLQLAVMEAGVWIPLALLGIHEATRSGPVRWPWFGVAGLALGLSLMAGHPQTSLFFGYLMLAYLGWRVYALRRSWLVFVAGAVCFGLIGGGLAAVQLLPGWEYTRLTARSTLNFDAMGNGFPFYDVVQTIFPGFLSLWSPLYFGIVGLMLVIYAIWRSSEGTIFWLLVGGVSLGLSFGHGSIVYDIFYNLIPGFSLFRGQERSAYLIVVSASVLAGLGTVTLLRPDEVIPRRYRLLLIGIVALIFSLGATLFINWLTTPGADNKRVGLVAFSLIVAMLATGLLSVSTLRWRPALLVGLVVFELFSFGRTTPNLEAKSPANRLQIPPLVQTLLADKAGVFRVDGTRAVRENYGTLYGLMDIQGTSPLRLTGLDRILRLPDGRAWEVLAVRYVPGAFEALSVPSQIVAKGEDAEGPVNLHRLDDPRPFARLVYRTWIEPDDNAALGILSDPSYDARNTVMLAAKPDVNLLDTPPTDGHAEITAFAPESIAIHTGSSSAAILVVSSMYYPGWEATLDGQLTPILRADTAISAVVMPAGDHTVQLNYRPFSYQLGALISVLTLALIGAGGLFSLVISLRRTNPEPSRH